MKVPLEFTFHVLIEYKEKEAVHVAHCLEMGLVAMEAPFRGRSAIAHPYRVLPGHRFDILTIRAIVSRLGGGDHLAAIESELYPLAVGNGE